MASVDALLAALQDRTREYTAQQHISPDPSMLGWRRLARSAMRVLVKGDAPTELMPILRAVLRRGRTTRRQCQRPHHRNRLHTLGVLADTINSHPEIVAAASHADRSRLRSCVLRSLHDAATATLSGMTSDTASSASEGLLRDLADTTEAACYVPGQPLHGALGLLSLGPASGDFAEIVAVWAKAATDVLRSPTRVTGYAFQRTAACIAQLCDAAGSVFAAVDEGRSTELAIESSLASAFQSWQIAADWPPEVVLGGRTTELRRRSQDLDHALAEDRILVTARPSRTVAMQSALLLAGEVGICHEFALTRLVDTRGLWIVAHALGPAFLARHPGTGRNGWIPDPGSASGSGLLTAAHRANTALQEATDRIDHLLRTESSGVAPPPALWESVILGGSPHHEGTTTIYPPETRGIGR
jgi:hypothetical protein